MEADPLRNMQASHDLQINGCTDGFAAMYSSPIQYEYGHVIKTSHPHDRSPSAAKNSGR
jgi:hypothetical protein